MHTPTFPGGWNGRFLLVDLTTRTCRTEHPDPDLLHACPGGRALGLHFLGPAASLDWNDPHMPVSLCAGPLTGTPIPGTSRIHLTSRSPHTGAVGDASAGGQFGPALKQAGWDAVVFTGQSKRPCGLEIQDQEVRFTDAPEGLRTSALFSRLRGFDSVACVGPAAAHDCTLASVLVDRFHGAHRTGLGRSLGVKGLRYVAVRGSGQVPCAHVHALKPAIADILRLIMASPALAGRFGMRRYGEAALCDPVRVRKATATANHRRSTFPKSATLNAPALERLFSPRAHGCGNCPVQCHRTACLPEYPDPVALPGFDSLSHWTALVENTDLGVAVRAHALCLDLGLDPISAAGTLACLAETQGRVLSASELPELLHYMAQGDAPLSRGAQALHQAMHQTINPAQHTPPTGAAMTVKGLELPGLDLRGAWGAALSCTLSTRGACLDRALAPGHEILRKPAPTDRFRLTGKARIIKQSEDQIAAGQSLGLCARLFLAVGLEELSRAWQAVTGLPPRQTTARELARLGERVILEERRINADNGFTAQHDDLPARMFQQPEASQDAEAGSSGLNRAEFLAARHRYYAIRGLDAQGRPPRARQFCSPACRPYGASGEEQAHALLQAAASRMERTGLTTPDHPPLLAVLDDRIIWNDVEPGQAGLRRTLEDVLQASGAGALALVRPAALYAELLDRLGIEALEANTPLARLTPSDCETRTFLHDIPVCASARTDLLQQALADRKCCLVPGLGILALGGISLEQALVTVSSVCFAGFVLFCSQLWQKAHATRDSDSFSRVSSQDKQTYARLRARLLRSRAQPPALPLLQAGPFQDAGQARAAMAEAGRAVVAYGLVDSSFGNVSCLPPPGPGSVPTLFISQTGSFLDELEEAIDPCPMDGSSTACMTASSELSAHEGTYAANTARQTILHGHPRFAVILSMLCREPDADRCAVRLAGECHVHCPRFRVLGVAGAQDIPIVPGEVGTGPTGLCHTLPPALQDQDAAVVYGHGVFAVGTTDFRAPFRALYDIEAACERAFLQGMDQALAQDAAMPEDPVG